MSDFQFKFKRGTKEALEAVNPILLEGEPCFELDTYGLKIGDGVSSYNDLPYSANPEEIIKIIN
jgi:hyaluronoglucosaminidase